MSARAARAAAAAVAVARAHGLGVGEPVLLADRQNVVVHLAPAPIVARVATMTASLRPDTTRPFGREVRLAGALAAAGAAVVPPSAELPPGPHVHDGLTVSFWRHVDIATREPTVADVGTALRELHTVLAGLPPDLLGDGAPLDTPFDDLAVFTARAADLGADPGLAARTGELAGLLRPLVLGPRPRSEARREPASGGETEVLHLLHGDPHPGNLLATGDGWTWTDLEDTCRGPLAWDLACLRATGRLDGRAAAALAGAVDEDAQAPFDALRRLHVAAWWQVVAHRDPGYATEARERLATAVADVSVLLGG